ncbi:START-like domain-containing protein [Pedobacter flavus]|uniref:START-like domain-containing protein n=1 Tax=Pedobacter flavus TaxID=3113906 RepID=A0ABU7H0X9_9SPHI|nr:START-like domain-containing protein [Pedobacter sp. VNH31]MEE1884977.1 START-like domain-containing protein [Pedobacter sp. VNH31]
MSEKKKFNLEYALRSSPRILFSFISEPNGLAQWFADDVNVRDQVFTFTWDGETQKAKLVSLKENKLVRFKWVDDDPQYFFEMEIVQDELTNDVALNITDFATPETLSERISIWDNQIDYLMSVLGGG